MSPVGRITFVAHLAIRSACGSSFSVRSVSRARSAVAGDSCCTRPRSSDCPSSSRVCVIHGKLALIVAGVSRTPGRISRANARVLGNELLSEVSALSAVSSVGASRWIDWRRLPDCDANDAIVVLKFVIRSLSDASFWSRPLVVLSRPAIRFDRSCGCSPRNASLTIEVLLNAGPPYL